MTTPTNELPLDDLSGLALDDVQVGIGAGTFRGVVKNIKKILHEKDGVQIPYLIFTFQSRENKADTIDDWKRCGRDSAGAWENADNDRRFLKMRIMSLGVPEDKVGSVPLKTLIGTPVVFSVKINGQYKNVSFVQYDDGDADSVGNMLGESNGDSQAAKSAFDF